SLGFFLCAYTTSLHYLFFCYGVLGGIGNGFGYATVVPVMAKWIPDKRGLAIGLALAGYGGGSAIFGPSSDLKMLPAFGWANSCMMLVGIFFVMAMGASFLLKNPMAGDHASLDAKAARISGAGSRHSATIGHN